MFRSSYKICAVVVLVLAVPPSARGALYEEHCDDLLPQVLNVGLPRTPGLSLGDLRDAVSWRLTNLYAPLDRCGGGTRLQVNIAIGNDYQILDWLGQGLIDVAVVPDLSLYLLSRDRVELLEPPTAAGGLKDLLAPLEASLISRSFAAGRWTERTEPERDFESFRWQLWCGAFPKGELPESDRRRCSDRDQGSEYRIALTSHLSTGGFLRPVSETAKWLADRLRTAQLAADDDEGRALADRFWTGFFNRARFTLDGTLPDGQAPAQPRTKPLVEIVAGVVPAGPAAGPAYRDHLVITARAADSIFYGNAFPQPAVELAPELKATLEATPAPAAFRSLLAAEPYFGVRTFGFTVDEAVGLLRQHQQTSGQARLALVLPGGGVKAVYQSQLVDSLYGEGYLKNRLTDRQGLKARGARPDDPPLDVDFVIGTSGGALLGYFVARLAENGPWNLSEVLWQNKDKEVLDSTDIFGWTDLPRYLSVVAIFLVFSSLLFVGSVILRKPIPVNQPATEDFWRPRLTLAIVPLLVLTPVLIRWVNGKGSQEHIPEIEGLFYAVCISAAIFADQCLVFRREPRPNGKLPLHPALPLLLGLILVAVPVWRAAKGDRWLDRQVSFLNLTLGSLLVCLGILSLLAAGMLWTYASRHYRVEEAAGFKAGFSLSLFLVFAVYGVLGLVMFLQPDLLSPLELTAGFWKWLLATSLIIGLLILLAGCVLRRLRVSRGVFSGLSFLCSHHPNSSLMSRRFLRIGALAIGAFLWWNFVLAPALYGNAHARGFLDTAVDRFHSEYAQRHPGRDVHQLTAQLLVPANVLERDGTRFFLVVPYQLGTCPPISSKPGSGALWYTYRISPKIDVQGTPPRGCPNFSEKGPGDIKNVIFASGSPFPIFPAHLVELTDAAGNPSKQALVDGGYSNNEPVDAALNVAAEQVLIVESTNSLGPAGTAAEDGSPSRLSMLVGPLVADLLRLPGFLFERSQQVDRLSRRGLFVVTLSPSRDEVDWPPLFDFRGTVVKRLRDTARADLARRIGLVESWGPPRFQLSVLIGESYSSAL